MLLGWLFVILLVVAFFKITGFILHILGKVLGGILGIIGWLFLAGLAVTVFGLALFVIPLILIVGLISLIVAAAS